MSADYKIAVIGLGYVGLPLLNAFSKKFNCIGFDIDTDRVAELRSNMDRTGEIGDADLNSISGLITDNIQHLAECNIYVVTVPTPVDESKAPDLRPLVSASKSISPLLKKDDIVIYESTVYPGCTEEICVPALESSSVLKFNVDFFCGYSPERVNPGDKVIKLENIMKITSGSNDATRIKVDSLYRAIITAGTYSANSIKVAEAAKVVENVQRDVNISLMNELSLIFDRLSIDTLDVLDAASTKWNFHKYKPGLVGGHCIGVDPYYLAYKARMVDYDPQVILSGRRINDYMPRFVCEKIVKEMVKKCHSFRDATILILGVTFKENCPDYRNSKVIDLIAALNEYGLSVDVYDPVIDAKGFTVDHSIPIKNIGDLLPYYSCVVLAVPHDLILNEISSNFLCRLRPDSVLFDVKGALDKKIISGRL